MKAEINLDCANCRKRNLVTWPSRMEPANCSQTLIIGRTCWNCGKRLLVRSGELHAEVLRVVLVKTRDVIFKS